MFTFTVLEIGSETVKVKIETAQGEEQIRILGVGTSVTLEPSHQKLINHLAEQGVIEHKTVLS